MTQTSYRKIQILSEHSINRIAAGEVIERPASAVKELVENSIDAGANTIEIIFGKGGKSLIKVVDDGIGISHEELPLAIQRHATSKIADVNVDDIRTLGFRGEALPSMGAAGHLVMASRFRGNDTAFKIEVRAGQVSPAVPVALGKGTVVELTRLFHSTPARLKFLKSDKAETRAIIDTVRSLALAFPEIGFSLHEQSEDNSRRKVFALGATTGGMAAPSNERLNRLIDASFTENVFPIEGSIEEASIKGYCSLPTFHRGAANAQFFFVNNRPVKDKLLIGAMRGAYADVMPKNRHPLVVLYLQYPPELVDVNVHPAKAEVRFQNSALIRTLIVKSIREALEKEGYQTAPIVSSSFLDRLKGQTAKRPSAQPSGPLSPGMRPSDNPEGLADHLRPQRNYTKQDLDQREHHQVSSSSFPMGAALVQLHKNYIVSQTTDGMIIVDQHAAHERIVYEKLKQQLAKKKMETIPCLVPAVVELTSQEVEELIDLAPSLKELGLVIEQFGSSAICVRETPAILGSVVVEPLIRNILDGLAEGRGVEILDEKMNEVISRMSCHGSIRSGRVLTVDEMNELLREMEVTPLSGQCNHGRPTFVKFKLNEMESLFGRKG